MNPKYVRPPSMMKLLKDTAGLADDSAKVQRLKENKHSSLLTVLKAATDPNCLWTVTDTPQFHPASQFDCNYLYDSARRLYIFCEGLGRSSTVANDERKRNDLWRNFLEEHGADECELILLARKKVLLEILGISLDVVQSAFPELKPNSDAAVQEKGDASRRKASTIAQDNLRDTVKEAQAMIKELDGQIRQNEQQHRELMDLREREFQKIRIAGFRVGELS